MTLRINEKPIVFDANEVNAVLAGNKTQHRVPFDFEFNINTVSLNETANDIGWSVQKLITKAYHEAVYDFECPFGAIGDRLWVQEGLKHRQPSNVDCCMQWAYASDNEWALNSGVPVNAHKQKLSAKSMPRWASRSLLEITDIRIERVQDISEADAMAMGLKPDYCDHKYQTCEDIGCIGKWAGALWLHLRHDKKYPVHHTAWVWVIEFKKAEG